MKDKAKAILNGKILNGHGPPISEKFRTSKTLFNLHF